MTKTTIFYLEGRGEAFLFHFITYNLGGLYYIMNKQYNIRGENGSSLKINDTRIVDSPSVEIKYPITIYMNLEN